MPLTSTRMSFRNPDPKPKGFTLIEVMIVLGILVAVMSIGVPRLFKSDNDLRATVRKMIFITKDIRLKAKLTNSTYRLVIHLSEKDSEFWVEKTQGPLKLSALDIENEIKNIGNDSEKKPDKDDPPSLFQMDTQITKKKIELPSLIRFSLLETLQTKEPITEGYGFIHFSPEGLIEPSVLQVSKGKGTPWTVVFNPITGQADVIDRAITLKDIKNE
ncbi:MAG TPA: type II secretion system protein [Pseudobdellovibrionaceae bacterium]|nr:type II secretion system protein [Pseudobdellovibrionaceae bacterium]